MVFIFVSAGVNVADTARDRYRVVIREIETVDAREADNVR